MPYGKPGAAKLNYCVGINEEGNKVIVKDDTICQPLYPCADQDGYNGEWTVFVPNIGKLIIKPEDFQ